LSRPALTVKRFGRAATIDSVQHNLRNNSKRILSAFFACGVPRSSGGVSECGQGTAEPYDWARRRLQLLVDRCASSAMDRLRKAKPDTERRKTPRNQKTQPENRD
jgi:hypothetical protein